MLKNYFKIAWRNLLKNKTTGFINLFGLAIGMTGVILIGLWVQNEYSFEQFHTNKNDLYKIFNRTTGLEGTNVWDITSEPLGTALKKDFPEIKNTSRIYWSTDRLFQYKDKTLKATGNEVDPSFLDMFTFPLLRGNKQNALNEIHSIILTENLAKNIFGKEDPMNKIIRINNDKSYKVTGVLKNLPNNTEFNFNYLMPLTAENAQLYGGNSWGTNTFYTYVQLAPQTNIYEFEKKIKNEITKYAPEFPIQIFLHPISKWHLYSRFENGKVAGGRIETVHLITLIGFLILMIACINFMNLSTAQSQKRAKEVGVRKVIGAGKRGLIIQFLCESILTAFMAGLFALLLVQLTLPYFNRLIEKSLYIPFGNPILWISFFGFVLITGLMAGSYPAFFLSSFTPIKALKDSFKGVHHYFSPRRIMVVLQFSIAIVLVVSTLVIYRQVQFVQNREKGYDVTNLVEVPIEGDIRKNYDLIKRELLNSRTITAMGKTSLSVTVDGSNSSGYSWEGMNVSTPLNFSRFGSGGDFIKTLGLTLSDGRDLDLINYPGDSASVLLNETAVKQMDIKNPIGKYVKSGDNQLKIVGIFKDFIIGSPYDKTKPMIIIGSKNWIYNTVLRLNDKSPVSANLSEIEKVFKKFNPAYPFIYKFVDQEYRQKFKDEEQTGTLSAIFAGLTIFISCLGLFGLATFMAENRSKEIGIRKVLGANVSRIVGMLSKEFAGLVLISFIIAVPVSWWAMTKWLEDFNYRITIGWGVFAISGVTAILVALLSVSFQAIKAALANPVKSLRTE